MDTGGPPGRFDVCLGVGFVLGQFVEVPEESLADTGASGAGVGGGCSTISRYCNGANNATSRGCNKCVECPR